MTTPARPRIMIVFSTSPKAVTAGTVKLVGTDTDALVNSASALLDDAALYRQMTGSINPYGDGRAAKRIVGILRTHFVRRVGA